MTCSIKICGITSVADARMLSDTGIDYLGVLVNVRQSPRSVGVETAAEIVAAATVPVMALRNVKLTIAYDGSDYHGWQIQPGCVTIQGVLTEALRSLLGPRARVCGASRTDAGVSALGQVGLIQIYGSVGERGIKYDAIWKMSGLWW